MTLHLETISSSMLSIGKTVHEQLDSGYYLAGGTALSLLIGHRKSIDLDYFINAPIDTQSLHVKLIELFGDSNVELVFQEKNTLWTTINGVKVSFIARLDPLLEPVSVEESFRIAQLKDLTMMKLSAICSREEYKDYFDLACLVTLMDVRSWIPLWQSLYPHVDPISWVVALSAVKQIPITPLDIQPGFLTIDPVKTLQKAENEITNFLRD